MYTGFKDGLEVPQEWLDDSNYGIEFLSQNSLFLIAGNICSKSSMPKERSPGRNSIISATFVSGTLISLSEDDIVNVFVKHEVKNCEKFKVLFCLGGICLECEELYSDTSHLRRHMKLHTGKFRQCPKCTPGTPIMDNFTLRKHMELCVIRCPYNGCSQMCQTRDKLKAHAKKHKRSLS